MRWLSKCCCCISLRTGSLIAGAWTLFTAVLMISLQVINVLSLESLTTYEIKHGTMEVKSRKILASLEIVFGIVLAAASSLLLIAIVKERRKLLFPYVVGVLLYEIYDLSSLIFYLGKGVEIDSSVWIPDVVILCINMYCILTVLSLYKEMTKKERWTLIRQMDSIEY